jgi:lambda family phage portal protein
MNMTVLDPDDESYAEAYVRLIGDLPPARQYALGGAYEGAARFDRQIASWNPALRSADADILPEKRLLDARARDLHRNDAYIQWGEQQHRDSIVGSFFLLNSKPGHEVLGRSEAWAEEFQREVEAKFMLWAESPHNWPDASGQLSFTGLIRLAVGVVVFGGEALATVEWMPKRGREFRTAIQMIDTDRLSTPPELSSDPLVKGGIRHDRYGRPTSYFIRTQHPSEFRALVQSSPVFWKEVPARKPWGRHLVGLFRDVKRVGQTRSISELTAGLREVAITRKFRDVTLQNAVLNASYAATIESELPTEVVFQQLGAGADYGDAINGYASSFMEQVLQYSGASKNLQLDGARIPHLFPGTRLQLRPAGSPGGVGQEFETSMLRYVAALLGLSYEELSRDYTKTNYSSARAAMLGTWRFMQARKRIIADRMADFVYRLWLEEAINNDRIDSFRAADADALYTDGYQNLRFDALAGADWIGAARGQIDELAETQAATLRIKYGLSTHEEELSRLGKDWRKVYAQIERERKERDARGIVLQDDPNAMNAVTGEVRDDRQGGEAGDAERDPE